MQTEGEFFAELRDDPKLQEAFLTVTNQSPNWCNISTPYGHRRIAVGDTPMKFDPLSGQGIYKAFETAFWASYGIRDYLSGDASAMAKYNVVCEAILSAYHVNRIRFYYQETTYQTSFWLNGKTK